MNNKPETCFKAGPIQATVWQNETILKDGTPASFRTVELHRSYKNEADEWKSTPTLRVNDIPKARYLLNKAYEYCIETPLEAAKPTIQPTTPKTETKGTEDVPEVTEENI